MYVDKSEMEKEIYLLDFLETMRRESLFVLHLPHLIVGIWWKSNWAQTVRKHKTGPCEFCVSDIAFPWMWKNILTKLYCTCRYVNMYVFIVLRVFIESVYSLWAKNRVSFDRHNGVWKVMNKGLPCIINLNVGKNRQYLRVISIYYM